MDGKMMGDDTTLGESSLVPALAFLLLLLWFCSRHVIWKLLVLVTAIQLGQSKLRQLLHELVQNRHRSRPG